MKRTTLDISLWCWNALGIFIILGFFVFSFIVGGSATLGYTEEYNYFVGNHGDYTKVSQLIYTISYIWEILFWIFIPLTPIGGFLISNIHSKIMRRKNRFE